MSLRQTFPRAHLPKSHYFITIARGEETRTLAIRSAAARTLLAAAALVCLWSVAATLYLVFHDDLMAGLIAHQTALQYAYEDRLVDLRNELDRVASQRLLDQNSFEGKVHALLSRQAQLEARATLIESLAADVSASRSRGSAPAPSPAVAIAAPSTSDISAYAPMSEPSPVPILPTTAEKPRLEDGQNGPGPVSDNAADPSRPRASDDIPIVTRLSLMPGSLDRIESQQIDSLAAIGRSAQQKVARFDAALATAGLTVNRFAGPSNKPALGGPFVPLKLDPDRSPFEHAVWELRESLADAERVKELVPTLPLRRPASDTSVMTSPFGVRTDPFNGRLALHTGVDFALEMGAPVYATAAGRVTIAGPDGGYGNLVEIDHGHGLSTRYAHLSSIAVQVGERVDTGTVVGTVGATGRATGPHLHYETRIDGEAVDPVRFLRAGQQYFAAR